jgi:hypothetical protein
MTILPKQPAVTLYENDQVDLTCKTDANPAPVVVWTKDNDDNVMERGEHLLLTAVQSLPGTYTCTASNGIGSLKKASFIVTVKGMYSYQNYEFYILIEPVD